MDRGRRFWWRSAGAVGLAALAWSAGTLPVAGQEATIGISRVDTSAYPEVAVELSAPSGLTGGQVAASDVVLLENGAPVPFTLSAVPTERLEVVLLFDTSGSMREEGAIDAAKQAATGFLDALPPEVQVGIVAFADRPSLVSPLTGDRALLRAALGSLQANGETALYDAIVFARSLFSGGTPDRQFVLLSDGGDTVSRATLADAVAVTAEIRTSAIELISSEANRDALVQLTAAGQGALTSVSDPEALAGLYLAVANSLVNRYRLTFTSTATGTASYTVQVAAPGGVLEASTAADLPEAPNPTTGAPTTTEAAGPTSGPSAGTTVAASTPDSAAPGQGSTAGGSSGVLLVLGALAVYVALATLLLAVWPFERSEGSSRRRLGTTDAAAARGSPNQGVGERLSGAVDRALERRGRRHGLASALEVAGISLRPGEFVVLTVSIGIAGTVVLYALFGRIGLVLGLILVPLVARAVVSARIARRRQAFADQLPDVLQLLVSSLRAGYALPQGLDAVANQAAEPARSEFERVMFESRIGRDLSDALAAAAGRMASRDFDWVVAAFDINRDVGGDLASVLENVAATIRERQQLRRQIKTLTAEGRISAYVLTALPVLLAAVIGVVNPDYFEPLTRSPGPQLIAGAVVLMVIGWIWMRRLIKAQL